MTIHIEPDSFYELNGYDLIRELTVETPAGEILIVKMPAGIQDGQKLRLKGKGMPRRNNTNGDMYVRIRIDIPRYINEKQKALWEELAKLG